MSGLVRHGTSVALATALTAWILFRAPAPDFGAPAQAAPGPAGEALRFEMVERLIELAAAEPEPAETPVPVPLPDIEPDADPVPPPPEAGSRSGSEEATSSAAEASLEVEAASAKEPEAAAPDSPPSDPDASGSSADTARARAAAAELQASPELVRLAYAELSGEAALGFSTVLLSDPADQLAIARAFGEEVVLVPRATIDPNEPRPGYWRIEPKSLERGVPRVESVEGRPALERFRQHRTFLRYDYAALPEPLRDLRKRVIRRDDLYIFGALIPASEWAVVIGRRREALEVLGVAEEDVEQFVLSYVRTRDGFDVAVDRVVTADGRTLSAAPRR
ncbi:MAG: hypothetical protein AAFU73_12365 [Planctomycetota bacterium]